MRPLHLAYALVILTGCVGFVADVTERKDTVTVASPVCPPQETVERVVVREPALVKDCEFSEPCRFRSIYDYQRDVRRLQLDRLFAGVGDGAQ